jgi:hypothetical protein
MMEAGSTCEPSANYCQAARRNTKEDSHLKVIHSSAGVLQRDKSTQYTPLQSIFLPPIS